MEFTHKELEQIIAWAAYHEWRVKFDSAFQDMDDEEKLAEIDLAKGIKKKAYARMENAPDRQSEGR